MEFKYRYQMQPSDMWQFRMYYAYSSYLAVINIICMLSSVVLLISMWKTSPWWLRVILLLFLSLFTVIQPLSIYVRAKKDLLGNQNEIELAFQEQGVRVAMDGKEQNIRWNQIVQVTIKPTMVVVYTDAQHGYILTNRVMKDSKKEFVRFLKQKRKETIAVSRMQHK